MNDGCFQIARNLLDAGDGFLLGRTHLILDRDPLYTQRFRQMLKHAGVMPVRLPANSPNLNAYAERFVGSIRRECLSLIVPLGEQHLRHVIGQYVVHYNSERNHQGVGNVLLMPAGAACANDNGVVGRRKRLGGMLSYYHREAA